MISIASYTPAGEKYQMSDVEQAAVYLRLKKEAKEIQNEIASLEADMKKAGRDFGVLAEQLKECRAETASWDIYADIFANLPKKITRYQELQYEKADREKQLSKFTQFD
jgi:hypothetical protein